VFEEKYHSSNWFRIKKIANKNLKLAFFLIVL